MLLRLKPLLALACLLRCAVFLAALFFTQDLTVFHAKDTASYLQPAQELLTQGSFTTLGEPEIIRTPGYPLLLSFGLRLQQVEIITILLQIMLSCLTVYLVFLIAKNIFHDEPIALRSALLCALEPLSIIYSCWLLSDTLFVTLLAVTIFFLLQWRVRQNIFYLLNSALALAAAIYVRPIGYLMPFIFVAVCGWQALKNSDRKYAAQILVWALSLTILLGAWHMRNVVQTGYSGFSAAADFNLYFHQNAALRANRENITFYAALHELGFYEPAQYWQLHPEQINWTAAERYQFMRDAGAQAALSEPRRAVQIYLQGLGVILLDPGVFDFLRLFRMYPQTGHTMNAILTNGVIATGWNFVLTNPLIAFWAFVSGALLCAYYSFALLGFSPRHLSKSLPLMLLFVASLSLILLAGGTIGAGRFRLPVMLVICILGGRGLSIASANTALWRERLVTAFYEITVGFARLSKR